MPREFSEMVSDGMFDDLNDSAVIVYGQMDINMEEHELRIALRLLQRSYDDLVSRRVDAMATHCMPRPDPPEE